jgi:hypothetical protein
LQINVDDTRIACRVKSSEDRRPDTFFLNIFLDPAETSPHKVTTYRDVPIVRDPVLSDSVFCVLNLRRSKNAAFSRRRTELAWSRRTGAATSATGTASQKTF